MTAALNPLWAGWPYVAAALLLGGWWSFRVIAQGWTQKRAERAISFRDRWGRLPERTR